MKRLIKGTTISVVLILTLGAGACEDKLVKAADRSARVSVYAQTAKDSLPLFAVELKMTAERQGRIDTALGKARDFSKELSITLDGIKNKAIDAVTGNAKVKELLAEIIRGIDTLNSEGFFDFPTLKPDVARYARLAILGLRTTVALLQADLRQ